MSFHADFRTVIFVVMGFTIAAWAIRITQGGDTTNSLLVVCGVCSAGLAALLALAGVQPFGPTPFLQWLLSGPTR